MCLCLSLNVDFRRGFGATQRVTDVPIALANVCFEGRSGSGADLLQCRSLTQLRHWAANFAAMRCTVLPC